MFLLFLLHNQPSNTLVVEKQSVLQIEQKEGMNLLLNLLFDQEQHNGERNKKFTAM